MKNLKLLFQKKPREKTKGKFHGPGLDFIHDFKYACLLIILCLTCSALNAQVEISGNVTDESTGEVLPGVNVIIKGTTTGAVTDANGHYQISMTNQQSTLEFSYIGYLSENILVNGQSVIDVALVPDLLSMEEVVVVGYGTMKKSDVTGAIVSISDQDLQQVKATNIMESIQGKAAGVEITRSSGEAGSGPSVLVRGNRTLSGNNSPLYIIDGVQSSRGTDLNPNEIESIEILKDISSTSIYGAKGANGVIIITTKRGKEGKPRITFNSYVGVNKPLGKVPYMNRNDYLQYKEDLAKFKDATYRGTGEWPDSVDITYQPFEEEGILNGTNTNWFDLVSQTGYLKNYFLSVSGGKSGITYNLSLDHTNETGMIKEDAYKRYLIKGGVEVKVNNFLSVGTSNILTYKHRDRMGFPEKQIRLMNPLAEPYDSTGVMLTFPTISSNTRTPLWSFQEGNYNREEINTNIFSNVYADIRLFEGLNFHSNLNVSISNDRRGEFIRESENLVNVKVYISPQKSYTLTNILTYEKNFGIHHIQVTGVHEMQKGNTERYQVAGRNPQIENSLWYALNSLDASSISIELDNNSYYSEGSQLAFLGRVNYSLMGKYVATASLRYDGSSVLANGNKWDYFPAASVAWNISEEDFLNNNPVLSLLKIRLSYGTSGNYTVPAFSSLDKVNLDPLYYEFGTDEAVQLSYRPVYAGNPLLSWEKTSSINAGLDFGMFKNRLSGNIDVYKASTTDILQNRVLPPHAAIPSIWDNIGETSTSGIEIMLHSVNINRANFKWSTDVSLTFNKEKIVFLATGVDKDEANGWFVGEPLNVWYDYEKSGIWQLTDSAELAKFTENDFTYGDIKIKDQNNDSIIDEDDRVILGQKNPAWYGSISNNFQYKNFDVGFIIVARVGQMVEDAVMNGFQVRDDYAESGFKVDYWTPENPTNEAPRLDPSISAINYMPYASSLLYTDGSWIKVRDISLGYTLPGNALSRIGVSSLRVYVSVKNAMVLYSPLYKKGRYDPEMNGRTSWPIPRTFTTGLTLDF